MLRGRRLQEEQKVTKMLNFKRKWDPDRGIMWWRTSWAEERTSAEAQRRVVSLQGASVQRWLIAQGAWGSMEVKCESPQGCDCGRIPRPGLSIRPLYSRQLGDPCGPLNRKIMWLELWFLSLTCITDLWGRKAWWHFGSFPAKNLKGIWKLQHNKI